MKERTYGAVRLDPVLLCQIRVEKVIHVHLQSLGVFGSRARFVLQRDKDGFRGVLVKPGVETEEDVLDGGRRAQQGLGFRLTLDDLFR